MAFAYPYRRFLSPRHLFGGAAIALLLGLSEYVSLTISRDAGHIATLRPICGIAIAIALMFSRAGLRPILLATALGSLAGRLIAGQPVVATLLSIAMTAAFVATICGTARHFLKQIDFRQWKHLLGFLAISSSVSFLFGGLYAALLHGFYRADFTGSWLTWSFSTTLSCAIFTPIIRLLVTAEWRALTNRKAALGVSAAIMVAVLAATFGQSSYPLLYLVPLALIAVTLIGEIEAAALGLALTAMVAIAATWAGHGPATLVHGTTPNHLLVIEWFLGALTTGLLPAAAAISERQMLRGDLLDAVRRAESARAAAVQASEAKSEFLANMSHEIRTPLTSIIGFSDLLFEYGDLNEKAKGFAARVRTGSRTLLALINDILDYSKLESRQLEMMPAPTDMGELADDVIGLLGVQAKAKDVKLTLICAPEVRRGAIAIDSQRVRQILLNLVGNAIKFTDSGSVTLQIGFERDGGNRLRCRVADTGEGIPADRIDKLFQRFSQLDSSTTKQHGGTGLGLAICKGLTEAMGGTIGVSSVYGEGSVFWFEIPADRADVAPAETAPLLPAPDLSRRRVLVVDDHEANRILVSVALVPLNVEVVQAENGEQAVALAQAEDFDLILMDIRMPGIGGQAAMTAIRAARGADCCPVVAFTADGEQNSLAALIAAGFTAALSKPLDVASLRSCVKDLTANGGMLVQESRHVA